VSKGSVGNFQVVRDYEGCFRASRVDVKKLEKQEAKLKASSP
jgi:hypothetical protein